MKNENKRVAKNLRKQACCSIEKIPYIATVFHIYGHGNHCQNDKKKRNLGKEKCKQTCKQSMEKIEKIMGYNAHTCERNLEPLLHKNP